MMNMRIVFFTCLILGTGSITNGQAPAGGQPTLRKNSEARENERQPLLLKVYPLRYRQAEDASRVLIELLQDQKSKIRFAADSRTNALIANADAESLKTIEELIRVIDSENAEESSEPTLLRLPPSIRNSRSRRFLEELAVQSNVVVSSNDDEVLVAKGKKKDVFHLMQLIEELAKENDTQSTATDYLIRFVILTDKGQEKATDASLKPALDRLESLGYKDLSILTQSLTACKVLRDTSKYEATGTIKNANIFKVSGSARRTEADPQMIDLDVLMSIDAENARLASIGAKVVLAPGKVVLLGTTPTNDQTTILLVQLLPASN